MFIAHMQTMYHGCHVMWALLHLWRSRPQPGTQMARQASRKDKHAASVKGWYMAQLDVAETYAVPCFLMDGKVYQTVLEVSTVQSFSCRNINYKVAKDMCVPFIK